MCNVVLPQVSTRQRYSLPYFIQSTKEWVNTQVPLRTQPKVKTTHKFSCQLYNVNCTMSTVHCQLYTVHFQSRDSTSTCPDHVVWSQLISIVHAMMHFRSDTSLCYRCYPKSSPEQLLTPRLHSNWMMIKSSTSLHHSNWFKSSLQQHCIALFEPVTRTRYSNSQKWLRKGKFFLSWIIISGDYKTLSPTHSDLVTSILNAGLLLLFSVSLGSLILASRVFCIWVLMLFLFESSSSLLTFLSSSSCFHVWQWAGRVLSQWLSFHERNWETRARGETDKKTDCQRSLVCRRYTWEFMQFCSKRERERLALFVLNIFLSQAPLMSFEVLHPKSGALSFFLFLPSLPPLFYRQEIIIMMAMMITIVILQD